MFIRDLFSKSFVERSICLELPGKVNSYWQIGKGLVADHD